MQVDREIEVALRESPGARDVVGNSRQPSPSWDDD
jgi:hypothetical protein